MKQIKPFLALLFTSMLSLVAVWAADMCVAPIVTTDLNVSAADPIELGPIETVTSAAPDYYYIRANPADINGSLSLYFTGTNVSDDVYMAYSDSNCPNTVNYCTLPEANRSKSLELNLASIDNNDINVKIYTCASGNKNYGKLKVVYTAFGSGLPDTNTTIVYGKVDFLDQFTTAANYNNDAYIKTKISNFPTVSNISTQGYQIDSVWVNDTVTPVVPQTYASNATAIPLTVFYYEANDNCTVDILNNQLFTGTYDGAGKPIPVVANILPGAYSGRSNRFLMPIGAAKAKRLVAEYIDFYRVYLETGEGCLLNAQTGQNAVPGLPACVSSSSQYESAFGPVTAAKCLNNNGNPCDPNNHGYGTGRYDHMYGCYQCTLEGSAEYACSRDDFAIRPNIFDVNATHYDWPNLLRSAQDYNTTLKALNYNSTINTVDYNVTDANSTYQMTITKYLKTGAVSGSMSGTAHFASSGFDMANGLSVKSGVVSNEVAGLTFDDVGKINIRIEDREWSAVDINNARDTTPHDCSANGAYICGDKNVTFIPEHFTFVNPGLGITNNNGSPGTFTYIANEVGQMAGRIYTTMQAENKLNAPTLNFATFPLWENNVTVVPVVTTSSYLYPDANETNITNLPVGFSLGAKTIAWDETNTSQFLRFNFRRDVNLPQNSFDVNGTDLNISMTSHYVDPDNIAKSADINGSRLGSVSPGAGGSKFIYGRIIPRDVRVFGANTPFTANAWYEAYNVPSIGTTLFPASKNSISWFTNTLHTDLSDGDGNVTLVVTGANPANTNIVAGTGIETYSFDNSYGLGGYKAHILTAPWLWYGINVSAYADPGTDCLTHPCFNINIVPAVGATGSATSTNEGTKGSKKSDKGGTGWHSTTDYAPSIR